jgi:phospholipid transport system substrate-binding protein
MANADLGQKTGLSSALTLSAVRFVALVLIAISAAAQAGFESEAFVQQTVDRAHTIIKEQSISEEERERQLGGLLRSVADIRRIAIFTLGPYGRLASQSNIDAFAKSFEEYIVVIYQNYLHRYRDKQIKVTGSMERAPGDVIVKAEIVGSRGVEGPIKLAFRVRKDSNGRDRLTDLQFDGVWLAIEEREQFRSFIQQHNDDIKLLSGELARRTARMPSHAADCGDVKV